MTPLVFVVAVACTSSPAQPGAESPTRTLSRAAETTLDVAGGFRATSFTAAGYGERTIVDYDGPERFRIVKGPYSQSKTDVIVVGTSAYFSRPSGGYIRLEGQAPNAIAGSPLVPLGLVSHASSVRRDGETFTYKVARSPMTPKGGIGTARVRGGRIDSMSLRYNDGMGERTTSYSFTAFGSAPPVKAPASEDVGWTRTPSPPNPVAVGFEPRAVAFWDDDHGLLAGSSSCGRCPDRGVAGRTGDGGKTWHVVYRGGHPIVDVTTFGTDDAWITTENQLLHTTDRGKTWHVVSRANLTAPTFSSRSNGWAGVVPSHADYGPALAETTNGGRTWNRIPSPCSDSVTGLAHAAYTRKESMYLDLSNSGPGQGWVLCSAVNVRGGAQAIFSTDDGGATWTQRWAAYDDVLGMQILPDGRGGRWHIADETPSYEGTVDGGSTWHGRSKMHVKLTEAAWLTSDSTGYAIISRGGPYSLVHTADAGRHWHSVIRIPNH